MSKTKPVGKLKLSPSSNISGVKILKNFAPSLRRRRNCEKEKLDIYNLEANNDKDASWDAISPITPPAAFRRPSGKTFSSLYLSRPFTITCIWLKVIFWLNCNYIVCVYNVWAFTFTFLLLNLVILLFSFSLNVMSTHVAAVFNLISNFWIMTESFFCNKLFFIKFSSLAFNHKDLRNLLYTNPSGCCCFCSIRNFKTLSMYVRQFPKKERSYFKDKSTNKKKYSLGHSSCCRRKFSISHINAISLKIEKQKSWL